jgi:nucleoside-diphosphate-sugar epimerase
MKDRIISIITNENSEIKEAMRTIDRGALGTAFVVDNDGKLSGIVTDGDIRRALLSGKSISTPVSEVMNRDPVWMSDSLKKEEVETFLRSPSVESRMPAKGMIRIPILDGQRRPINVMFASREGHRSLLVGHTERKPVKRVLVVGGAGYIGSVLCRFLLENGYEVRVFDNLTYGQEGIEDLRGEKGFEFVEGNILDIGAVARSTRGVDAVVHLAALVGDPASTVDPASTIDTNFFSVQTLGHICKYYQINRFIFASTCSVYGAAAESYVDEKSQTNPISIYSETKLASEEGILSLIDENFSPCILRFATAYGLSKRMRFDLVVNLLTAKATVERHINIFGGEQWRPFVHVIDISRAIKDIIEAPIDLIRGQVFNIGSNTQNLQIADLGHLMADEIEGTSIDHDRQATDARSYKVCFDKVHETIGFECEMNIVDGIREIRDAILSGKFEDYNDKKYINHKTLIEGS